MSIVTGSDLRRRMRPGELLGDLLQQGLAPRQLALTVALGSALGTIPLLWGTSLVCLGAALVLRLNFIALQTVNLLCWPLHLFLLIPFFRLGQFMLPGGGQLPGTQMLLQAPGQAMFTYGGANLRAIVAWAVIAPPLSVLVYLLLRVGPCRDKN